MERKELKRLHAAATIVQKWVRGFLTRINMPQIILNSIEQKNTMFYDQMVRKIQASWRGYMVMKMQHFLIVYFGNNSLRQI